MRSTSAVSPPPPPPFRLAEPSDAESVVQLVNSAYRGESGRVGWTTESDYLDGQRLDAAMFADLLSKPSTTALILLPDPSKPSTPTACVVVELIPSVSPASVYIGMLTVSPESQRGGVGSKILGAAESYAKTAFGAQKAVMTVLELREELLAYYFRRGYNPTGEKMPFMYGQPQFGIPKRDDLVFLKLAKEL
ncbi:GCN5-like N-acetyltransferase [Cladochytrium replicatum]|nr:GCN5-like N-acetyltransferase [Cladochytrium replicatum]